MTTGPGETQTMSVRWADWVPTSELYKACLEFAKSEQTRFTGTQEAFGMRLARLLPPADVKGTSRRVQRQEDGKRAWGYAFPELDVCRSHFEKLMNSAVEWQSDGEVPPAPPTRF